jgi:hypothetical protein
MKTFTRTRSGILSKYKFYEVPLVWVEGDDDIPLYRRITKDLDCTIQSAGGKQNCLHLIDDIIRNNSPYIVIVDGDYDILLGEYNCPNIIMLEKYSIENYFCNGSIVENICQDFCKINDPDVKKSTPDILSNLNNIIEQISDLIILDIAAFISAYNKEILPLKFEKVANSNDSLSISKDKIRAILKTHKNKISKTFVKRSEFLVSNFLLKKSALDLLKGHFLFSIIRNSIKSVAKKNKKKATLTDIYLKMIMADEMIRLKPTDSHKKLIASIRKSISRLLDEPSE